MELMSTGDDSQFLPERDRDNVIFNVLLLCLNTKVVPFLSGFDGLSRPSSKSYNAFFVLFLSYLAIHEFLKTDGTDWAGIGAAV